MENIFGNFVTLIMSMAASALAGYLGAKLKENRALKSGMQAMLRDRMIQSYTHFSEDKGWMPIYAKEAFEACYASYHNLGANGVMDGIHEKVRALPECPPREAA